MDANRNYSIMKKSLMITALFALFMTMSCTEAEVPKFEAKDSVVYFGTGSYGFSMIGFTGESKTLEVPLTLVGPAVDVDRPVALKITNDETHTAAENVDFTIVSAMVPAGSIVGKIVVEAKNLPEDVGSKSFILSIVPNECFKRAASQGMEAVIKWSNEYERPSEPLVWQTWFLYFSKTYSRNLHKILVEVLGSEVEISSNKTTARDRDDLVYHQPTWWQFASREVYDYVRAHDRANPDEPYMHSADAELYLSSSLQVGAGQKYETIPTILETLVVL